MLQVEIRHKGDLSKTENFLNNVKNISFKSKLDRYGEQGVRALQAATPVDTGKTSGSWYYKVKSGKESTIIQWCNSNINDGVPIAIVLQYGHGTGTGGYVQGRDYINPAMRPVFDKIAEDAWREVVKQ